MKSQYSTALIAVVFTLLTLAGWQGVSLVLDHWPSPSAAYGSHKFNKRIFSDLPDFRDVAASAGEGVVSVEVLNERGYRISGGSGVLIDEAGYLVTNWHVVDEGAGLRVRLADNRVFAAQLVGQDQTTDLALLKIEAADLHPLQFSDSDDLAVGEWVLALGNPYNLKGTVTAGIVSAKSRDINILEGAYAIENFIQTDAVVNPGNSGGALVDANGNLVGINTAIISEKGGYEGYSFAVPSNLVAKVADDLREYGRVHRGVLGVSIDDLSPLAARRLGIETVAGVLIRSTVQGGGADAAGLLPGDVIVAVGGRPVLSVSELQERVARVRPNEKLDLEYIRQGKRLRVENVEVRELP